MNLTRRLATAMAAQAVLGAVLLGMGQLSVSVPILVTLAALVALKVNDFEGWFQLNRGVANVAALLAVALAMLDFTMLDRNDQLLAIANLLVYLQVVVFFQRRTPRVQWQLTTLSMLQVVVAAALNYSLLFGALLVVYLFLSLYVLSLFFLTRELASFQNPTYAPHAPAALLANLLGWRAPPEVVQRIVVPRGVRPAAPGAWLETRRMGLWTLAIAPILFYSVPRLASPAWQGVAGAAQRSVGFSPTVRLGALGEVVENPALVMRLQLFESDTGRPIRLQQPPLLRGSVVGRYEDRAWHQGNWGFRNRYISIPRVDPDEPWVGQRITLEPLDEPVVFSIYWPRQIQGDSPLRYDADRRQLVRPRSLQRAKIHFDLATTGIRDRRQLPVVPLLRPLGYSSLKQLTQMPRRDDGSDPLAGLRQRTAEVLSARGVAAADRVAVARALESYLHHEGGFEYTLKAPRRDPQLDPIEDFVTVNRRGHCEYFASALVMMLRSQDIPARMVIGFKTDEWNPLGEFYQVRQRHAHTWVEAYLGEEYLGPQDLPRGADPWLGGWLRLDPTAMAVAAESPDEGRLAAVRQWFDYLEMLWMRSVVGLDRRAQQRRIYAPLSDSLASIRTLLASPIAAVRSWWAAVRGGWHDVAAQPTRWGPLVALLATAGLVFLARRWWWSANRRRPAKGPPAIDPAALNFYRRLEMLLARAGCRRGPCQTQRELATAALRQLSTSPALRPVAPLPRQIVDVYYQARFGGHPLDNQTVQQVEQALAQLETALAPQT